MQQYQGQLVKATVAQQEANMPRDVPATYSHLAISDPVYKATAGRAPTALGLAWDILRTALQKELRGTEAGEGRGNEQRGKGEKQSKEGKGHRKGGGMETRKGMGRVREEKEKEWKRREEEGWSVN